MHLKGLSSYSSSFLLQMLFVCFQHNSSFLWKSTSLNICQNILIEYFLYQCKSIKQKSPIVLDSTQKRMSHNNMLLKNTSCLAASSLPSSWFSPVYLRFALKQKLLTHNFGGKYIYIALRKNLPDQRGLSSPHPWTLPAAGGLFSSPPPAPPPPDKNIIKGQ